MPKTLISARSRRRLIQKQKQKLVAKLPKSIKVSSWTSHVDGRPGLELIVPDIGYQGSLFYRDEFFIGISKNELNDMAEFASQHLGV